MAARHQRPDRDLLIAAITLAHDLTLVTHNTGEFSRVPSLRTEDWARIENRRRPQNTDKVMVSRQAARVLCCRTMARRMASVAGAPSLTRDEARRYCARWAPVHAVERDELRRMSKTEKLQQLAGLMASARALGWEQALAGEEDAVRARWNRLRKVLRGRA